MFFRWVTTVCALINNLSAISLFENPRAIFLRISASRLLISSGSSDFILVDPRFPIKVFSLLRIVFCESSIKILPAQSISFDIEIAASEIETSCVLFLIFLIALSTLVLSKSGFKIIKSASR